MSILFITDKFPPVSCGVGDYTYQLAREFVRIGYPVAIVCRKDSQIEAKWTNSPEGFKVYPIGTNWDLKDWHKVVGLIQQKAPKHVFFQYVSSSYNRHATPWPVVYFFLRLRFLSVHVVTNFHEMYLPYRGLNPKAIYRAAAQRIIGKVIAGGSHELITSIDRFRNRLSKWHKKIIQIPIGSNIQEIPADLSELERLRSAIAPNGETILCTFGVRDHQKLLETFSQLNQTYPDCVLLVIGSLRADMASISKLAREKIQITGFLDNDDVFRYLKLSDAFLMLDFVSNAGEGGTCIKSTSLAAAFMAGLPILATKGDLTDTLLLREGGIFWLDYHNVYIEKILEVLQIRKSGPYLKSREFYEMYLDKAVVFPKIAACFSVEPR